MIHTIDELKQQLKIYFIMGSNNTLQQPEIVLDKAIRGGVSIFQFREKGMGSLKGREKLQLASKLQHICRLNNVPFIVNDDIELALELEADGVHIGQEDASCIEVRKLIGNKILGVSTHNLQEVEEAIEHGADYLGIGPIFPTETKKDAKAVQGTQLIEEIRNLNISIPIVGIGGITHLNARQVIHSGADGVAVISEISQSSIPFEQTMKLASAVFNK